MTDRDTDRFSLAVDAITAAFTLVARHTVSSGTMEIINLSRQLRTLQEGDASLLRQMLHSLNALAGSPRLFTFRSVTTALAQSLPRSCSAQATSKDLHNAALDLRQLANEAQALRAPDVAVKLSRIIDAMLQRDRAIRWPTRNSSLH